MASRRQIEDRKPAMNQRHAAFGIYPNTVIVGAAVLQTRVHRRGYIGEFACTPIRGAR
jgi:hypothetical protein